jgi:hypothetical protein
LISPQDLTGMVQREQQVYEMMDKYLMHDWKTSPEVKAKLSDAIVAYMDGKDARLTPERLEQMLQSISSQ